MNTHESYVSLETAKMLKEAGFDWEVDACYTYGDYFDFLQRPKNCNEIEHWHSAPTLDVAQRWLREVMDIEVFVVPMDGADYVYRIVEFSPEYKNGRKDLEDTIHKSYKTYESALEAGINKCLTLLLKEEWYV